MEHLDHLKNAQSHLNQVSASFCMAKWHEVFLHLHNGTVHACHHPVAHKIPLKELKENPMALFNTQHLKLQRQKMIQGERPQECDYCWRMEDLGYFSDRHRKSYHALKENSPHTLLKDKSCQTDFYPTSLEVSFDHTCDFKCMYCSPVFSTLWQKESEQYGPYKTLDKRGDLKNLKKKNRLPYTKEEANPYVEAFWKTWPQVAPKLKMFRITGGEPLLSRSTWKIFEHLNKNPQPNLTFSINSNFGNPHLVERLIKKTNLLDKKIKRFVLHVSLDTLGEQAEYIRFGLNVESFYNNLEKFLQEIKPPTKLVFMVTVNALSLPKTPELIRWMSKLQRRHPHIEIIPSFNYLRHPPYMAVSILPEKFQEYLNTSLDVVDEVSQKYNFFSTDQKQSIEGILSWMKSPVSETYLKKQQANFYKMFSEHDRRRGTHFLKTFPEYESFWVTCKKAAEQKQWWPKWLSPS